MRQGIRPGDTVATIIDHREGDYWARLAQVKIIEEIPFEKISKLASLDARSHAQLVQVLQKPGAKAIVTAPAPPAGTGFRWDRLGNTEYYFSSLTQEGRS
jgi:predicted amidohydrolase